MIMMIITLLVLLFICICMYVYIYIHTHVHIYIYMYICISLSLSLYIYIYICVISYMHTHTYITHRMLRHSRLLAAPHHVVWAVRRPAKKIITTKRSINDSIHDINNMISSISIRGKLISSNIISISIIIIVCSSSSIYVNRPGPGGPRSC